MVKNCFLFIKYLFRKRGVDEEFVRALRGKKRVYWEQIDYDSWHQTVRGTFQDHVEKAAFTKILQRKGGLVLDVGAGTGRMIEFLEGQVVGCDLSLALLKVAQEKAGAWKKHFMPIVADSSRLPFKEEQFDSVISCRMLQHSFDWRMTLAEIARLVRERGEIVLLLYNSFSGYGIVRNIFAAYHNFTNWRAVREGREPPFEYFGHFNNPFDIRRELEKLGFTIEEIRGVGLFPAELFPEALLKLLLPVGWALEKLASIFPFRSMSGRLAVRGRKNVMRW